jgi:hypothetical protein
MSYFEGDDGKRYEIFGEGGGQVQLTSEIVVGSSADFSELRQGGTVNR